MARRRLISTLLPLALALAACDSTDSPVAGPAPSTVLDPLFAPPTAAETTLIASQWAARSPVAIDARVDEEGMVKAQVPSFATVIGFPQAWTLPDSVRIRLISHVVDGFRHHGALWTPSRAGSLPVLVFAHGGDDGLDSLQWRAILQATKSFRDSIAILAPSFRSEPVDLLSKPVSEGTPSPWDRDVEDLRALLRAAATLDGRLDTTRVCLVGYSRGGGVALLAAERDPVFRSLATVAAPTAFQGPWVRALADSILKGKPVDLPGLDYLATTVLLPYRQGTISLDSARRELIRRSATTWVRRLPPILQLHHGYADDLVPSQELVRLQGALQAIGRSPTTHYWPNLTHLSVVPSALQEVAPFVHDNLLR